MMNKIELRKEIRKRKKKFSNEELSLMSVPIIDRLWKNIKFISSNTILLYYSLPDEVNTHDLVKKLVSLGKKVLLPVVISDTDMELREYKSPVDMSKGFYDIYEPTGSIFTDYESIDLIVLPGMSFDKNCNRLGRGKGYYDRLLSKVPCAYKIGICFDFQKLDFIPTNQYDKPVDEVL